MADTPRIVIPEVGAGVARPLWSVMIPTYNCARYLAETLASVLAQDPGPEVMQIEVVDDHSTRDDPEAVVRELGRGRVGFYRQPQNVGHVRNFDTCLLRSRGRLIHLLHGDDRVRDGFYRTMQQPFEQRPEIGAAFCGHITVDEHGQWVSMSRPERADAGPLGERWLERIAAKQRLQTPCMVVRREVYEHLGGYDRRIRYVGEDWEMWVRIAAHYAVWHEPSPLAEYRRHTSSLSGRSTRTGEDMQDLRRVVAINQAHLARCGASAAVVRSARDWCAALALKSARQAAVSRDWSTMRVQLREGLRSSRSARTVLKASLLLARASVWRLRGDR